MSNDERLYTVAEVADMLGLSPARVRHLGSAYGLGVLVGGGVDPAGVRRGGRRLFSAEDIATMSAPRRPGWRVGVTGAAAHRKRRAPAEVPV
jgi:hypothetical protein